jgi:hypothetical protein
MKPISHMLILSCHKATELIEKKSMFPLTKAEKAQLFVHLKMCKACQTYSKQSVEIDNLLQEYLNPPHK